MKFLILWCPIFVVVNAASLPDVFNQDAIIKQVEASNALWKAGYNFAANIPHSYLRKLGGTKKNIHKLPLRRQSGQSSENVNFPNAFDSRIQWPNCPTIGQISDQGNCASSWAVASADAFSDRVCIASNSTFTLPLSAEEVLSCCDACREACDDGDPLTAWDFFSTNGLVTGGGYQSDLGCQPYNIQPCDHYENGNLTPCPDLPPSSFPVCATECTNPSYITPYEKDHHFVYSSYVKEGVNDIKQDILLHGPVVALIALYSDLLTYKSGIYHVTSGYFVTFHTVRIIGWGKANGTSYWLVANSWNREWGDQGLFKIVLGQDECGIEDSVYAGQPRI